MTSKDLHAGQREAEHRARRGWVISPSEMRTGALYRTPAGTVYTRDANGSIRRAGPSEKTRGKAARKTEKRQRIARRNAARTTTAQP